MASGTLHVCLASLFICILLVAVQHNEKVYASDTPCMMLGAFLHACLISLFLCMSMEARSLYTVCKHKTTAAGATGERIKMKRRSLLVGSLISWGESYLKCQLQALAGLLAAFLVIDTRGIEISAQIIINAKRRRGLPGGGGGGGESHVRSFPFFFQ